MVQSVFDFVGEFFISQTTSTTSPLITISNNPGSQPLVTLDFPAPMQQRVINALKADPNSVDLRAQAPHFYALGARILDLFEDDDIVDVLTEVSETEAFEGPC